MFTTGCPEGFLGLYNLFMVVKVFDGQFDVVICSRAEMMDGVAEKPVDDHSDEV